MLFEEPNQIKENDKVYVNRCTGEVLIFPTDESHDEEWIQEHLINSEELKGQKDKIFYAKSDILRPNFLVQKGRSAKTMKLDP